MAANAEILGFKPRRLEYKAKQAIRLLGNPRGVPVDGIQFRNAAGDVKQQKQGVTYHNVYGPEDIRRVRSVVNIHGIASQRLSYVPRVTDEPSTIGVHKATALPGVVWCLTADDDLGALGNELLASLGKVVVVCVDGNCLTVVCGLACLRASTGAD